MHSHAGYTEREALLPQTMHMSPPERVKLWQGSLAYSAAPQCHPPVYHQDQRLVHPSSSFCGGLQQTHPPNFVYDPHQRIQHQQPVYLPPQSTNNLANLPYWPAANSNSSPVKLVSSVLPSNVRGANEESEMGSPLRYFGWNDGHSRMDSLASTVYSHWSPSVERSYAFVDPLKREEDPSLPHALTTLSVQYEEQDIRAPPQPIFNTHVDHLRRNSYPTTYLAQQSLQQGTNTLQWQQYMADVDRHADANQMPSSLMVDNDAQSRRASTSTIQSSLPVSPDDATPLFSSHTGIPSDYFSATASYPSSLGKRSYQAVELDYGTQGQYFNQFGTMPVPTHAHNLLPSLQFSDQPLSSYAKPVPLFPKTNGRAVSIDLGSKRPRLESIVENAGLPLKTGLPASKLSETKYNEAAASVPSPAPAPSLHLHPEAMARPGNYRRLSSPIASVRPEVGGSADLDSDEDEEEDGNGDADFVDAPSLQTTCRIKTSSDSESEYLDPSGHGSYLPHHKQRPSVLSTDPYMPTSASLPSPLQPATAGASAHTFIATPTFSGIRSLPVLTETNDGTGDEARQQKLRFEQDLYTPLWVRGNAASKEGFCDMCDPGKWLQLKNSAFWYHKQFSHGISSVSGTYFAAPRETRFNEDEGSTEGLCHQCNTWVTYTTRRQNVSEGASQRVPALWYKHAHKCHVYVTKSKSSSATTKGGRKK